MTGHLDDEHEPLVSVGDSVKEYSNEDRNGGYRVSISNFCSIGLIFVGNCDSSRDSFQLL